MNKRIKNVIQYILMIILPLLFIITSKSCGLERFNSMFAVIEICMIFWVIVLIKTEKDISNSQKHSTTEELPVTICPLKKGCGQQGFHSKNWKNEITPLTCGKDDFLCPACSSSQAKVKSEGKE